VHNRYSRSHCSNAGVTWRHIADYHPARMNSGLRNDARDFAQLGTVSAGQRWAATGVTTLRRSLSVWRWVRAG